MTLGSEKRMTARHATDLQFSYSVTILDQRNLRKVVSTATAVDRSDAGMGFITDFSLEAGHVVKIDTPGVRDQAFMVKWVQAASAGYRVGGVFL